MYLNPAQASLEAVPSAERLPICVDLDGTLLLTDSFHESFLAAIQSNLSVVLFLPRWIDAGKACLKQKLAQRWDFDPEHLPYNEIFIKYLVEKRQAGHRIVLATGAHQMIAGRIAAHLNIFDEVIASDETLNLRGAIKAKVLSQRFGYKKFIYAGNDSTDLAVWEQAGAAIVVNASASLRRKAETSYHVIAFFEAPGNIIKSALHATRPYQWVKNLLCLVPLITAGDLHSISAWANATLLMLGFCLVASSIYVLNDLSDLAADRIHPRKRRRPIASGALPITHAMALWPVLLVAGAVLALASGAFVYVALYAVASLAYSMRLKEQPLVDVFMLAFLYTIRLFGGGVASGYEVSLWLLGFSSFLFLSLALVKRVSELGRQAGAPPGRLLARRGYTVEDTVMLQIFGCASTFASAIVLSLYVQSDVASRAYSQPELLWGSIPLLLFWQCRLWLSTARGYMHDDPIVYAARDWVSWLVLLCLGLVIIAAWTPVGPRS